MSEQSEEVAGLEDDRQEILQAQKEGTLSKILTYAKLAGPGWLQAAITIGGGSLAGGLFLGVIGGAELLWIQPLAVIMGVIMLSAISFVTLSADERPFKAMHDHVNPVLAWGWLIATIMANCVWAMPQFSLATSALRQNLLSGVIGAGAMGDVTGQLMCVIPLAIVSFFLIWTYDSGGTGVKVFEFLIRGVVAIIVLSFIGVVIKLGVSEDGIAWGTVFSGYIPDITLLWSAPDSYSEFLNQLPEQYQAFWRDYIVSEQQDRIITAGATAVGINMTFLMPYSMLKKGWDEDFRGLAIFDLSTGMLIPFLLVTSCIVIASMNRFHTKPVPGLIDQQETEEEAVGLEEVGPKMKGRFRSLAFQRIDFEVDKTGSFGPYSSEEVNRLKQEDPQKLLTELSETDRKLSAMLVKRDAFDLAKSLTPLTGRFVSNYLFGIGVVGVAISTILILMIINAFAISEALNVPSEGAIFKIGGALPAVIGALGPFIWSGSGAYLAVPTSIFGMTLLPVAYTGFWLMMNQPSLLGDQMPRGMTRFWANIAMGFATIAAAIASLWSLYMWKPITGPAIFAGFVALVLIVELFRE